MALNSIFNVLGGTHIISAVLLTFDDVNKVGHNLKTYHLHDRFMFSGGSDET